MKQYEPNEVFYEAAVMVEESFSDAQGGYVNKFHKSFYVDPVPRVTDGSVISAAALDNTEKKVQEYVDSLKKNKKPESNLDITVDYNVFINGPTIRTNKYFFGPRPKEEKENKVTDLISGFELRIGVPFYDTVGYANLKDWFPQMAKAILDFSPNGRERSLALTKLEECMLWIARAFEKNGSTIPTITWKPVQITPIVWPFEATPTEGTPFWFYDTTGKPIIRCETITSLSGDLGKNNPEPNFGATYRNTATEGSGSSCAENGKEETKTKE